NAENWYRDDVTVDWHPTDGLSDVDLSTLTSNRSMITGEGRNLSTEKVSVSDNAGNTQDATFTANIDRTAPVISGAADRQPNANHWYNKAVTVSFSCGDALSGIATCPEGAVLSVNGSGQSVSGTANDKAGNSSDATVDGINIDALPPTTTETDDCVSGQCSGDTATVTLSAVDQAGLSGVQELRYSVNEGPDQPVPGATATVTVPLSGGTAKLTYYAVDNAGNQEPATTKTLSRNPDTTPPAVTHKLAPEQNAAGWNKSPVTVTFVSDGSDVTPPVTVSKETGPDGVLVEGWA